LLRFNFPLISTRLSFLFVSFDLSLLLQLCLPSQNGALDVPLETFDALNWACSENLGGCFVETSAKNNLGVKDAFSLLLEQFLRKRHEQKGRFQWFQNSCNFRRI
jgi:hypothetical protein